MDIKEGLLAEMGGVGGIKLMGQVILGLRKQGAVTGGNLRGLASHSRITTVNSHTILLARHVDMAGCHHHQRLMLMTK